MDLLLIIKAVLIALVASQLLKGTDMNNLVLLALSVIVIHQLVDHFIAPQIQWGGTAGYGIQSALGLQRKLRRESVKSHTWTDQQSSPNMPILIGGGCGCQHVTKEGMDNPMAKDYYSDDSTPDDVSTHAEYDTLIATMTSERQPVPAEDQQVDIITRMIDDRMALRETSQPTQIDVNRSSLARIIGSEGFTDGLGPTPGERGLVYGTVSSESLHPDTKHRVEHTLYSGDLIQITTIDDVQLVLPAGTNYVTGVKDILGNQLFKLRFLTEGHSDLKLIPIRYGDSVNIVYTNDRGESVKLNHQGDLNNLKNTKDITFRLINRSDPNSRSVVKHGEPVLLWSGKDFARINQERKRVETDSPADQATDFIIKAEKGCGPLWRFS